MWIYHWFLLQKNTNQIHLKIDTSEHTQKYKQFQLSFMHKIGLPSSFLPFFLYPICFLPASSLFCSISMNMFLSVLHQYIQQTGCTYTSFLYSFYENVHMGLCLIFFNTLRILVTESYYIYYSYLNKAVAHILILDDIHCLLLYCLGTRKIL